jgi:hypothetical protein
MGTNDFGRGLHVAPGRAVDTSAYDRYIGRGSRLFVPAVLAAAEVGPGCRILDVSTGTVGSRVLDPDPRAKRDSFTHSPACCAIFAL